MIGRAVLASAAVAALGAPVAARAMDDLAGDAEMATPIPVSIGYASYSPQKLDIVAGDTLRWTNDSVRQHTVTETDGAFDSGRIVSGSTYSHRFTTPGVVTYYCTLHAFAGGEVDVHELLLSRPAEPTAPGRTFHVTGRSSLPSGTAVTVEQDTGAGYQPAGTASVADDGTFAADIVPRTTGTLRATAGAADSPGVQLVVLDRHVAARVVSGSTVTTTVSPASPGATVVLQLRLREHFGWWPVARKRLDRRSRATFRIHPGRRVRARVVLTLRDGATVLGTSPTLRVGPST